MVSNINIKRPSWSLLTFILIFSFIGVYLIFRSFASPSANSTSLHNGNSQDLEIAKVTYYTQQLNIATSDLKQNPNKKSDLSPKIKPIAQNRHDILIDLIKNNPQAARNIILNKNAAATLQEIGADSETPVTLVGILGIKQVDDSTGDHVYTTLKTPDGKMYYVNTEQTIPKSDYRATVSVSGWTLDDQFLVGYASGPNSSTNNNTSTSGSTVVPSSSQPNAPITVQTAATNIVSTGVLDDLVMMGNFSGGSGSLDAATVKAQYNGHPGSDAASFVTENTQGKASLSPTFVGVNNYPSISCSDSNGIYTALQNAATSAGYSVSNFTRITYYTNCNNGGATYSGGNYNPLFTIYLSSISQYGVIHELSHSLGNGISHGGYFACAPQVFPELVSSYFDYGNCNAAEYQDPYDVLGGQGGIDIGQLSSSHKIDAGWIDSTQVTTVSTPGTSTYTLAPFEPGTGLVSLKIPRGNTGGYITVEYRQPNGFDSYISNSSLCDRCNANKGALIRLGGVKFPGTGGGSDSLIIDNSPNSIVDSNSYWPSLDGNDGTLLPGQAITDSQYGITIKTISASSTGLTVQVTIAPNCVNAAPAVSSVTPTTQSINAGQSVSYNFTVTNNDSLGCQANQFRFASPSTTTTPNTPTVSANPDYFTLAPGASKTVTLTTKTFPQTTNGSYFYTGPNSIGDQTGWIVSKTYGISPTAIPAYTLNVTGPTDTTPPSVPSNFQAKVLGANTIALSWTPSSDNVNVAGYTVTIIGGTQITTTNSSVIIPALLPNTSYSFNINAYDTSHNNSSVANTSATTTLKTDTTVPGNVSNINANTTDHGYTLSWSPAKDNVGIACYTIGVGLSYTSNCQTPANNTSYSSSGSITSLTQENLNIVAYDYDGNVSVTYVPQFYTLAQGDQSQPSQPNQLYALSHTFNGIPQGTQLTWQPSTGSSGIVGYYIYRNCCRVGYSTSNNYFDPANEGGTYSVSAVDSIGSSSEQSTQFMLPDAVYQNTSDATPPSSTLTNPINGSTVSGTIQLTSQSSDNVGITGVEYYIDGQKAGLVHGSSGSFSLNLDTTQYSNGQHWLLNETLDGSGNMQASTPVNIIINNGGGTIDTTPPTVSITSPGNGASVSGIVNISANASDNVGVSQVVFQVDGVNSTTDTSSPYTYSWDSTKVSNGNHTLTATASDAAGNISVSTINVVVTNADTTPPSAPTNLSVSAASYNKANLSWTASSDNVGVAGYYVVRNGVTIAQLGNVTSYSDTNVNASTSYNYNVMAYDAAGNVSSQSNTSSITTPPAPDSTPPSQPTNLVGSAISSTQINLSWTASTDNVGVTGYDIYRNSTKIATVSTTTYGDSGLSASTTYSYYVVARDGAGNVSTSSSTISVTTQAAVVSSGTLSGTVYRNKNSSISGALVSLTINSKQVSASTNSSGFYSISSIPAGTYNVSYSASHLTTQIINVNILSGKTTTQNVTLAK